jgi:hypothetical protein
VENHGKDNTLLRGERRNVVLISGSQTSPVRPSDNTKMKVTTLEWLEAMVCDRAPGIFIFCINVDCITWKNNLSGFYRNIN